MDACYQLPLRRWILLRASSKPLIEAYPHGLYDWFR